MKLLYEETDHPVVNRLEFVIWTCALVMDLTALLFVGLEGFRR